MTHYVSKVKDALLEWAAEHNDFLQKWGERTKYASVGVGAASLAAMKMMGIEDPGTLSRYMVTPAAVIFSVGEGMKVLGEYSLDRKKGETDAIKNAGYAARITAPVYAAIYGSNGVWEGGHDVGIPVVGWTGGAGLTRLGEKRVYKKKLDSARELSGLVHEKTTKGAAATIIGHMTSEGKSADELTEMLASSMSDEEMRRYTEVWEK